MLDATEAFAIFSRLLIDCLDPTAINGFSYHTYEKGDMRLVHNPLKELQYFLSSLLGNLLESRYAFPITKCLMFTFRPTLHHYVSKLRRTKR